MRCSYSLKRRYDGNLTIIVNRKYRRNGRKSLIITITKHGNIFSERILKYFTRYETDNDAIILYRKLLQKIELFRELAFSGRAIWDENKKVFIVKDLEILKDCDWSYIFDDPYKTWYWHDAVPLLQSYDEISVTLDGEIYGYKQGSVVCIKTNYYVRI